MLRFILTEARVGIARLKEVTAARWKSMTLHVHYNFHAQRNIVMSSDNTFGYNTCLALPTDLLAY